jgi:predicted small metal-binding protein
MYEFQCGSPVCKTRFTAPTEAELMAKVGKHVAEKHHIYAPTKSLVQFLKDNTIREIAQAGGKR